MVLAIEANVTFTDYLDEQKNQVVHITVRRSTRQTKKYHFVAALKSIYTPFFCLR